MMVIDAFVRAVRMLKLKVLNGDKSNLYYLINDTNTLNN